MVRPLTKHKKNGDLYVRPSAVEAHIAEALCQDEATLERRLLVTDKSSPEYLRSECLVHLIREAVRGKKEHDHSQTLSVLLSRCEANLRSTIASQVPNAAAVRSMVLGEFSMLLAEDGADNESRELDYYECRFASALASLRKDVLNQELEHMNRNVELPAEREIDGYDEAVLERSGAMWGNPDQEMSPLRDELVSAIDNELTPEERNAVVLCYVMGYKVESANSDEVTAATRCNCTGRTIRNRLSSAAAKLSRFKEEL